MLVKCYSLVVLQTLFIFVFFLMSFPVPGFSSESHIAFSYCIFISLLYPVAVAQSFLIFYDHDTWWILVSYFLEFLSLSLSDVFSWLAWGSAFFDSPTEVMLCCQCLILGSTKSGYVLLLVILIMILC